MNRTLTREQINDAVDYYLTGDPTRLDKEIQKIRDMALNSIPKAFDAETGPEFPGLHFVWDKVGRPHPAEWIGRKWIKWQDGKSFPLGFIPAFYAPIPEVET